MTVNPRIRAVELLHAATALYTTTSVVEGLLDRLDWPGSGGRFFDPSCGDGSFLLQALQRLQLSRDDIAGACVVQGWEIHPWAVQQARERVADHLQGRGWSKVASDAAAMRIVHEKDFLMDGPKAGEFRIIAGNPPYLRFARLPEYFKGLYSEIIPKHAANDLLHAFLEWCVKLIPENGAIGMVCSDRFLFNESAADLRASLGREVGLAHLARLDARTSFYRPKIRVKGSPPRIHPVEIILRPRSLLVREITAAAISPDGTVDQKVGRTLGDVAQVRVAPWLGTKGVFVIDAAEAAGLLHADLVPVVDTDDIHPHTDELSSPKRFAIRTEKAHAPSIDVTCHLIRHLDRLPARARKRKEWWLPPELINLPLETPTLLIPRIAKRLRAIELPKGILPINHNLSVVSAPGMSLAAVRDLILSPDSQAWIVRNAPRLENGYYSITTRLLRRMPV